MILKETLTIGGQDFIHRYSSLGKEIIYDGGYYSDIMELASMAGNDEAYTEVTGEDESDVFTLDFWKAFQKNGTRKDYSYAFANWEHEKIVPFYKLECDNFIYLLLNADTVDASGITVECDKENPNLMGVCMGCQSMELPPLIKLTGSPFVKTWTSAFAGCESMVECAINFGDDTLFSSTPNTNYPIKNRNNMQNTFFKCSALETIVFSGKGSPKSLDLSDCVNLSAESIVSLSQHLYDVSSATSGDYTIKIASTTLEALADYDTEHSSDTVGAMEALGWTIEEVEVETKKVEENVEEVVEETEEPKEPEQGEDMR